jgi:hypothetical protein
MIELFFSFGADYIIVRVENHHILFGNTAYGAMMGDISGLKLNKSGVLKEFPDLNCRDDWREEAIKRFKLKIKGFSSEKHIANYIIEDLRKYGYVPMKYQIQGGRIQKIPKDGSIS